MLMVVFLIHVIRMQMLLNGKLKPNRLLPNTSRTLNNTVTMTMRKHSFLRDHNCNIRQKSQEQRIKTLTINELFDEFRTAHLLLFVVTKYIDLVCTNTLE